MFVNASTCNAMLGRRQKVHHDPAFFFPFISFRSCFLYVPDFLEDIIQELQWRPNDRADARRRELPSGVWSLDSCNKAFVDIEGKYSASTVETIVALEEHYTLKLNRHVT